MFDHVALTIGRTSTVDGGAREAGRRAEDEAEHAYRHERGEPVHHCGSHDNCAWPRAQKEGLTRQQYA